MYDVKLTGRRVYTPMVPISTPEDEGEPFETQYAYQAKVGSLLYAATCGRPDIQHPVSYVSQGNQTRTKSLVDKVERILKYCAQSKAAHLTYGKKGATLDLVGYCDASFGANCLSKDQRSNYGWIFLLGGSAISWTSKKFDSTSLSTTTAEYMAIKEATQQAMHLRELLQDFESEQTAPTVLYGDNEASIKIANGEAFCKKLRHVNAAVQWVREELRNGVITLKPVKTDQQAADYLTKPLYKAQHASCCQLSGLNLVHTFGQQSKEPYQLRSIGSYTRHNAEEEATEDEDEQ